MRNFLLPYAFGKRYAYEHGRNVMCLLCNSSRFCAGTMPPRDSCCFSDPSKIYGGCRVACVCRAEGGVKETGKNTRTPHSTGVGGCRQTERQQQPTTDRPTGWQRRSPPPSNAHANGNGERGDRDARSVVRVPLPSTVVLVAIIRRHRLVRVSSSDTVRACVRTCVRRLVYVCVVLCARSPVALFTPVFCFFFFLFRIYNTFRPNGAATCVRKFYLFHSIFR